MKQTRIFIHDVFDTDIKVVFWTLRMQGLCDYFEPSKDLKTFVIFCYQVLFTTVCFLLPGTFDKPDL